MTHWDSSDLGLPQADDFTPNQLGDRYQTIQMLGKKPGRRTLLACDRRTQKPVVIKLLSLGNDFEWADLKLFEREAETLKMLSHPAIPQYLDYLELDNPRRKAFALVQSYAEGRSLEAYLTAGRTFSEAEVKQLAKAVLEILLYLHSRTPAVIHRDIKPSNVLLGDRTGNGIGTIYLVDFGAVQHLLGQEGGTITVVGTYGYMPPEQFGGRAVPASDLYSLGATLIYLVTGMHPAELPQTNFRIQFERFARLSPDFTAWLQWMVEPSLDKRARSAQEALQMLDHPQRQRQRFAQLNQPVDSQVRFTKTDEALDICLPSQGLRFDFTALLSFFIPIVGYLFFWMVNSATASQSNPVLLFTRFTQGFTPNFEFNLVLAISQVLFAGILSVAVAGVLLNILFALFGQIRLRINQQHITLDFELFGLRHRRYTGLRSNLCQLELINRFHWRGLNTDVQDKPGQWQAIALVLHGRKRRCKLDISILDPSDVYWLAQELSHWLHVPIADEPEWLRAIALQEPRR
ncbi:serine/threonine protein kinase [Oculatella sp. LEGE 06141]|uniref:serine/threonine protein kinase n=1 Tax=Oculatella sp. LEGE 06141 TaxID=1828648 RepID=UPI0018829F9C|nr:serine/threonine-protein kinase [Oculatella sp. LEGE 06141]MBE9180947.1 serine/threonine protein kinase [Oculatella sp. LEGE 06141]